MSRELQLHPLFFQKNQQDTSAGGMRILGYVLPRRPAAVPPHQVGLDQPKKCQPAAETALGEITLKLTGPVKPTLRPQPAG